MEKLIYSLIAFAVISGLKVLKPSFLAYVPIALAVSALYCHMPFVPQCDLLRDLTFAGLFAWVWSVSIQTLVLWRQAREKQKQYQNKF